MMTDPTATNGYDYGMPVHPVCDLFPLMRGSYLERLEGDILETGLVYPIVVHEGELVDGRNRLLACRRAHVKPRFVEWRDIYSGAESLARWIWSINAERRHLTDDQYLAVQVALSAWEEREAAKLKQIGAGTRGAEGGRGNTKTPVTESSQGFPKEQRGPAVRTKIAKKLNVSEHKVQQALNVQKAAPELLKQVAHGQVTLLDADKQVKEAAKQNTTAADHEAPAALMPGDLRPIMRPVLHAIDTALRSVVNDDQRLALVKAGVKGKPTMKAWTKYLEKNKQWQRGALLTALGNWVEDLDEEDATITPVKMLAGPVEERPD
jgi:hypothetical protein